MNAISMWMTVGEFRAQVVRLAAVLMIGAIAMTLMASLSNNITRMATRYSGNVAAASLSIGNAE